MDVVRVWSLNSLRVLSVLMDYMHKKANQSEENTLPLYLQTVIWNSEPKSRPP